MIVIRRFKLIFDNGDPIATGLLGSQIDIEVSDSLLSVHVD